MGFKKKKRTNQKLTSLPEPTCLSTPLRTEYMHPFIEKKIFDRIFNCIPTVHTEDKYTVGF